LSLLCFHNIANGHKNHIQKSRIASVNMSTVNTKNGASLENGDETNSVRSDMEEDAAVIEPPVGGGWKFTTPEHQQPPRYRQTVEETAPLCKAGEALQKAEEKVREVEEALCETITRSQKLRDDAIGKLERRRRFFGLLFEPATTDVIKFTIQKDYADRLDEKAATDLKVAREKLERVEAHLRQLDMMVMEQAERSPALLPPSLLHQRMRGFSICVEEMSPGILDPWHGQDNQEKKSKKIQRQRCH
jgi:hypothetical protein